VVCVSNKVAGVTGNSESRRSRAAVLREVGGVVAVTDVDVAAPGRGEVLVRMAATGVCQSDLSVRSGGLPNPLPVVLGHEGAGVVEVVGPAVTGVAPGDHVVLSWLAQCGQCYFCLAGQPSQCEVANDAMVSGGLPDGTTRYSLGGEPCYHMAGLGTFSEWCVVPAASAVVIPAALDLVSASLLGCAVLTGFGAAVNTAKVQIGESVAVVGCGGVGLNAIRGAALSGARQVVAVDPSAERREIAQRLGATDVLPPGDTVVKEVRARTGGRGADVTIEAAGRQETVDAAIRMTRRGGRVVLVGAGPSDVQVRLPAFYGLVMPEKTITGSFYGSSWAKRDIEMLTRLATSGLVNLAELVTQTFGLEEISAALDYCASGRGARAVVAFPN
jgi:S-(hydroxymethyl)glutathione dehydrogenase / alcohol dehydrogenase